MRTYQEEVDLQRNQIIWKSEQRGETPEQFHESLKNIHANTKSRFEDIKALLYGRVWRQSFGCTLRDEMEYYGYIMEASRQLLTTFEK